jgi:hypothetical protein
LDIFGLIMPRTRSTKGAAKAKVEDTSVAQEAKSLPPSDTNPSKLFVLPTGTTENARIVTLANPATDQPSRYFICPEKGVYEFLKISAPKADPRSWLLTNASKDGYLAENQDMFVATPIDPIFFLLPLLQPQEGSKESRKSMFLTLDDHVDTASKIAPQFKFLLQNSQFKPVFENRLSAICDAVDAGDESMYRISLQKLTTSIFSKAKRVIDRGLPASMEIKFVTQALQPPMIAVKREESVLQESTIVSAEASESQSTVVSDSETVAASTTTSFSTASTSVEITAGPAANLEIRDLLRLKTALDFVLRSYISEHARGSIWNQLSESKMVDFTPLEAHMKHLDTLRAEAIALRNITDNISRKRGRDDEELADLRAEKKRKKEEEEKKKKSESRAIKDLKKANTSGMMKLSSFFTKTPKKDVKA